MPLACIARLRATQVGRAGQALGCPAAGGRRRGRGGAGGSGTVACVILRVGRGGADRRLIRLTAGRGALVGLFFVAEAFAASILDRAFENANEASDLIGALLFVRP